MAREDDVEEMSPRDRDEYEEWLERVSKAAIEREEKRLTKASQAIPDGWKTVAFTPKSWARLKRRYERAVELGEESFKFEDNEFVTSFARYFIEYHDPKFGVPNRPA